MASDPWAEFQDANVQGADPWAEFQDAPTTQAAPPPEATPEQSYGAKLKSFAGAEFARMGKELTPENLASAAVRPVVKAVTAVPGIFADGAMGAWNLATGQNNELPSQATNRMLDQFTRKPEGVGKAAEFVSTTLLGSKIPAPQFGKQAPAGFAPPTKELTPAEQTFKTGREAGYVAPPSTVKPSVGGQLLESVGGKAATQQVASTKNQSVTNRLIREELGLPENAHLTREVLSGIRKKAGGVYAEVSRAGVIKPDAAYQDELAALIKSTDDISQDFPDANVAAGEQVAALVKSLQRNEFKASSAMAYLKELRKQASSNLSGINSADPAKKALGHAQRDAAGALEDMVMRHLAAQGKGDLATSFDEARTLIAKTYSVENALNPSTGNVIARQLASQLKKNKPLSGGIKKAAEFAGAFPKATEEMRNSGPVSALDGFITGAGGFGLHPGFFAWPAARMGARYGLLSGPVQNALVGKGPASVNALARAPYVMGSAPAFQELQR